MWSFNYPGRMLSETGGQFTVRFPNLPEAITSGVDRQDALQQAADCLAGTIAGRIVDGLEIPQPSRAKCGEVLIALSGSMARQ